MNYEYEHSVVSVSDTREHCADACAAYILSSLGESLKRRKSATIALSGGHTPTLLFSKLADSEFDWSGVHFFWVDERCVPPTDEQSNFKLAKGTLLAPANIPERNVHRVKGELPPEDATATYAAEIRRFFKLSRRELPVFDVIHRGIGPDAHTASLFPGDPLIEDRSGTAAAVWVEKLKSHRVTLLPGVLLAGRSTVIQAEGKDKADAIWNVLCGPEDPMRYPCQIATRGTEGAMWFLDKPAASKLLPA